MIAPAATSASKAILAGVPCVEGAVVADALALRRSSGRAPTCSPARRPAPRHDRLRPMFGPKNCRVARLVDRDRGRRSTAGVIAALATRAVHRAGRVLRRRRSGRCRSRGRGRRSGRSRRGSARRDGLMIEPDVSVPTVSIDSAAAPAVPEPDDEPLGFWSASRPWRTWPVRLREARRLVAEAVGVLRQAELAEDHDAARAQLLRDAGVVLRERVAQRVVAVDVYMPFTSIRSLSRTGRPCAGPRTCPSARSLSSSAASFSASLLSCVTALRPGAALVQRLDPRRCRRA